MNKFLSSTGHFDYQKTSFSYMNTLIFVDIEETTHFENDCTVWINHKP